ncbi:hypothetical protein BDR06DRAFT_889374 [Suillus hirtellus]|nr:hypothetical protein BDR06DRAFT_889374 [Suillus hirtellus]
MSKAGIELPENIAILSARKLPHGGILYELNATTSAAWINIPTNRSTFLNHFGADIIIKDCAYHLLLENVPISFDPNSQIALADMERKGSLTWDNIIKARYIKPIARRSPNQRTAHVTLTLKSKNAANQIIRFGISIEGKKVYGRKLLPEPTRCLKCHVFNSGHIAADCPQEHDTCGTCGAEHRTASCTVDIQELYHCANCKVEGHASWS